MSPTHVTAGALAAWFLWGSVPVGPEGPRPGAVVAGLFPGPARGSWALVAMIFRMLWRAGLDSVAGEFGPDAAGGRRICSDSSKNRAMVAAGVLSSPGCCRQGSVAPGVVAGSGYFRPPAHGPDGVVAFFAADESVLGVHRDSWAKKAVAFFRNSASIRASRSSAFNRRCPRRSPRSTSSPSRVLDALCAIQAR